MQYHDTDTSLARVDAHLALAHQALERMHPAAPAEEPAPDWHLVAAGESRANPGRTRPILDRDRIKQEFRDATNAASDALVEHLVQNREWRNTIHEAVHTLPQGAPVDEKVAEVRRAVLGLGLMGIPPMVTWARVAKRLLSQLAETGDEYRVRCHVVALEEAPAGTYRAQGDHGQAWDGDWEPAQDEAPWYYHATPALTLQGYSYGPLGEYAYVQRAGKPTVMVEVTRG